MRIEFPDRPAAWYDVDCHTITFPVIVNDQKKACVVDAFYLIKHFTDQIQFTPPEAKAVFEEHKLSIQHRSEAEIRTCAAYESLEVYVVSSLEDTEHVS